MTTKPKPTPSIRGEFIETETGNKISRRASILGPKHIILAGKCVVMHDAVLNGNLVRPSITTTTTTSTSSSRQTSAAATTATSTTDHDSKSVEPSTSSVVAAGTSIHLGRYVFISASCTLHPPSRISSGVTTYYPLRISDNVYIGPSTTIRAAEIRSGVSIGAKCVIGNLVIIKENVRVLDGTVLPANSVWAAGSVVAGRPGRVVGEVGEGWGGGSGGGEGKGGLGMDEGVGVRARERWASVGNKR